MNGPQILSMKLAGSASVAVGAGLTIYTDVQRLDNLDTFALGYKVACTGVPSVKIELEQSFEAPTANAADVDSVVPETISEIETALADTDLHIAPIFPVCAPYMRLKITELTGIVADTVLTINLCAQNRFQT